jgi:co-chaperonin GroES (HSP10)
MSFDQQAKNVPNESWIDPLEVKDPKKLPRHGGLTTLVRPVAIRAKVGNILLPDTFREAVGSLCNVARVLSISGLTKAESEYYKDLKWKVGDYVVFGKYAGIKMKYQGVKLVLLNDEDVKMLIDDPSDLDPAFNMAQGSY